MKEPKLTFIEWLKALENKVHFYPNKRFLTFYCDEIDRKLKIDVI